MATRRGDIKRNSYDKTISDAIDMEDVKVYLRPFNRYDPNIQSLIFDVMDKAVSNVLTDDIVDMIPFTIPFIGRIKVSEGKKFEINSRSTVAKEFGYDSFDDMPREIYDEACAKLVTVTKAKLTKLTKTRKKARIEGAINPKTLLPKSSTGKAVRTINLAKIKQQCIDRKS